MSLTVKAVHLNMVSDLTTDAFITCLRCFTSCCGFLSPIWGDYGTNFVGATREIKDLYEFYIVAIPFLISRHPQCLEALTSGHFLIGRPLQTLPDDSFVYVDLVSSLCHWKLCQAL